MSAGGGPRRPWDAEHRPDLVTVQRILERQFPPLARETVRYFSEGWDFTVFAVGDDRLLRFPKRAATLPWMAREIAVLDAIQGRVPAPLPSDRILGEPSPEYPFPFVGYRYLPGVPLDTLAVDVITPRAADAMGRVVGATLRVVHAVPLADLPPAPSPRDEMDVWIATSLAVLASLEVRLTDRATTTCRSRLEQPPPPPERIVVTHGDLGPEHILVDDVSCRVTGIIDWSDAGPWDAAGDFVGLWVELGERGLDAALEAYGPVDDAHLSDRVRFHGTRWLLHQVKSCDEGWRPETRGRWLRRIGER